jgi:hypothetical protein
MSPVGVIAVLLLALVIDYASVGPNSTRDRVAFLLALPAIRSGFDGSTVDRWTLQRLTSWVRAGQEATGDPSIISSSTSTIITVLVSIIAIVTIGALLPEKTSGRLGQFALISFSPRHTTVTTSGGPAKTRYRINWRLWACATILGLFADLPQGQVGTIVRALVDGLTTLVSHVPTALFGVS